MKQTHLKQLKYIPVLGILCIALAGCGQRGPLYLPEEKAEQNQPEQVAPATSPSTTTEPKQEQ